MIKAIQMIAGLGTHSLFSIHLFFKSS